MNIQQLEYLLAVDKFRHFGKAAKACYITQPTLSAMIQKLEDELDLKIFDRTVHPIRTTDAGKEIIVEARKIMDHVMALKNKANYLNHVVSGKIVLGIIPTVSSFLLPEELLGFLEKNPQIELTVKEMTTENVIKALQSGEIDAGIISTPYAAAAEFFADFLYNEELLIYASDAGLVQDEDSFVIPEGLDLRKIWLLEEGNCLRTQAENVCKLKKNEKQLTNLDFKASNVHSLIQMVDKMGGLTVIPEMAKRLLSEAQQKKVYHLRKPHPKREVSIIYYKPTFKQKLLDEMVGAIRQSLKQKLEYEEHPNDFVGVKPE